MSEVKQGANHEYEYLSGIGKWAKLFVPSQYNKYSIDLNLDQESLAKVLELKKRGIKNTVKKDDDGYWITLSSPSQIDTRMGPKILQPPGVVNTDGSEWDPKVGIGNGSAVTCKVWVRKYKNPRLQSKDEIAIRLFGVKIDTLVPFNPKTDFTDDRKRIQTEGLSEQERKPW